MVTLHAFEALFAGLGVVLCLSFALSFLMKQLAPDWESGEALSLVAALANLGSSFLAAAAGGYVTAWLSAERILPYTLVLGIVVLVLASLSALQERGEQPATYLLASIAIAPLGVLAGGLVRLRVEGVL
jgi:ethanolamine transporter EutH